MRSALEYILRTRSFTIVAASDAATLGACLAAEVPDLVVFEESLPGVDPGLLCSRLRVDKRTRHVAIIVLATGDGQVGMRHWQSVGADDVVAKPIAPEHLLSRIHAALSLENGAPVVATALTFADISMDTATYQVRRNGTTIHLAPMEFRLLHHLMKGPHRVYSRDELQSAAWPQDARIGTRTIDVHMARLRYALKSAGGPDVIRTVRSVGYGLLDPQTP